MSRLARLVVPDVPHQVTQRGNRGEQTFFSDGDYAYYLALLGEWSAKADTRIWAWCLMPNHVHLILVPAHEDGLRAALAETHRRYTRHVNLREGWRGHLWQSRYASFPIDEDWLMNCLRYVELSPVRAGLVKRAEQWRWSSAGAHLGLADDGVTETEPMLERIADWRAFLDDGIDADIRDQIRASERTGHALGSDEFLARLAAATGRRVKPRPRGRPRQLREGAPA